MNIDVTLYATKNLCPNFYISILICLSKVCFTQVNAEIYLKEI